MTTRKRLTAALGANLTSQAITALIQIVSIPVFLYFWTLEQYGMWLVLAAIPSYFALADFGFLAVTINKMTIVTASGDSHRANILFQTSFKLWQLVLVGVLLLSSVIALSTDYAPLDATGNKLALILLATSAIFSMSSALADAIFRSKGEFAFGTQLGNGARIIEWLGLLAGLAVGGTFLSAAIGQFSSCILTFLLRWKISHRRHPEINWSISAASNQELRELFKPALAFMAFPLGNAVSIQGMTLIVGHLFGPAFLAMFNTYRTLARIQMQAVSVVGRSIWPEISHQFGAKNQKAVFSLTRHGTLISIIIALTTCIFLYAFGEFLLQLWTSGRIPFQPAIFHALLVPTLLTSFWQMTMVALSATNNHLSLSSFYLLASVASVSITAVLGNWLGVYATVAGLILFEITMIATCFASFRSFIKNHA